MIKTKNDLLLKRGIFLGNKKFSKNYFYDYPFIYIYIFDFECELNYFMISNKTIQ